MPLLSPPKPLMSLARLSKSYTGNHISLPKKDTETLTKQMSNAYQ